MQKLQHYHSPALTLRGLRFLLIRLGARPQTQELVPEVRAAREALQKAADAYDEARERRIAATAEIIHLDAEQDAHVMNLSRAVLMMTDGNRDDARYKKLFPEAPSTLTAPIAGDKQTRFVSALIGILRDDAAYDGLNAHADILEADAKTLADALEAREALYLPESKAQAEMRVALDKAKRLYNLTHPRLQLIFPEQKSLVESHFIPTKGRGIGDSVEDSDTPDESETTDA